MVTAKVNTRKIVVDGERERVLHLENVLRGLVGVDRGCWAREQSLQCLGPLLLRAGLRRHGGHAVHPLEHLRRHPPAGGAVDAPVIDEELAGDVLLSPPVPVAERRGGRRGADHRGGASAGAWARRRRGEGRGGPEAERHGGEPVTRLKGDS